ncbi:hypothetical protein COU91_03385 [Candidatus Saccharibacteria bacterium CG10_big_fil_rev_8_21_14_0_10_47_8]|nr:MAG: hypothetical protein COU91_03385 [Candidatus Saccharibacteria bacterium CG10_big_fil_rev_8_21_14_0_10_47_8]
MKFISKVFAHLYQRASHHSRRHVRQRPYIVPLLGLVLGGLIVTAIFFTRGSSPQLRPSDSHVVFLYDNGQRQTLDTKAASVGGLINNLNLHLIEQDVVEPSLDTPIVEDNFRVNIYHARPVTVIDNGVKTVTLTAQKSARMVATQAGLKINAEDLVTFAQGQLKDNIIGEKVVVTRGIPVAMNLYGAQFSTYTQAKTVSGLLVEKRIKLDNGETVAPEINTPIKPNLQVFVLRKDTTVVTTQESVPAPVQTIGDPTLSLGATAVRQVGSPGKKAVTYLVTTKDGAEVGRVLIQEALIENPIPQITARGTTIDVSGDKSSLMAAAGIKSSDYGYVNYVISHESGWCPTKAQGEYGTCRAFHGTPSSGGYGLGQATPGSKMASAGADWATNPVTQLKWCTGYAVGRYGSWAGAYNHWLARHNW